VLLVEVMVEDVGAVLEPAEDIKKEKKHHKEKKEKKHKHKHKSSHKKAKGERVENGLDGAEKTSVKYQNGNLQDAKHLENSRAAGYDSAPESGEIPVEAAADEEVAGDTMQEEEAVERGNATEPSVVPAKHASDVAKDVAETRYCSQCTEVKVEFLWRCSTLHMILFCILYLLNPAKT
jgi:hypothetical protein